MNISFIGLGIMGSRMAANLIKAGISCTVFNRSEAPLETLSDLGARIATNVKDAVAEADIVFSMLSNPEVVRSVMLEEGTLNMREGSLWVDCSTVNPSFSKEAEEMAKRHGVNFLEAPVAGTKPQAESGELVFFVGGNESQLKRVEPILLHMGNKVLPMGEVGKASSFKMVVNMMLGMGMIAFAESLKFGEALGLNREMLISTIPNLPVSPPFTKMKAELIRDENFEPQFPLELLHKDLQLASISAGESGQDIPFTETAKELYAKAIHAGLGREDMASIYKYY